jgi:hypothetical protein
MIEQKQPTPPRKLRGGDIAHLLITYYRHANDPFHAVLSYCCSSFSLPPTPLPTMLTVFVAWRWPGSGALAGNVRW